MGTRGIMGVRLGNRDYLTYNHFDSYPEGLGQSMIEDVRTMLREIGHDGMKLLVENLKLVDEDAKPTPAEIEVLKEHHDPNVSTGQVEEWYSLLRDLQGKLRDTLRSGYMIDSHEFINSSLFCEWGYIVNLDTGKFEVYEGFQKLPHEKGRYANNKGESGYWPCALVAEFDIRNLPDNLSSLVEPQDDEE